MSSTQPFYNNVKSKAAKVLLAEDNRVGRLVAERLLQRWGYEVHIAANGIEALKLSALQAFDLILMNVRMPGLDGWETARLIRRLGAEYGAVPIVALSSSKLPRIQHTAPFTDFLEVPYMPEQLQHLLQQHLSTASPTQAHPQLADKIKVLSDKDPLFGKQLVTLFINNLEELLQDLEQGRLEEEAYLSHVRHKHRSSLRLLDLYSLEGALDNLQQVLFEQSLTPFLLQQRKRTLTQQLQAALEELNLVPIG